MASARILLNMVTISQAVRDLERSRMGGVALTVRATRRKG
jgi:hypothetical protein